MKKKNEWLEIAKKEKDVEVLLGKIWRHVEPNYDELEIIDPKKYRVNRPGL